MPLPTPSDATPRASSAAGDAISPRASSGAYYNEIDPFAAAWLRELIKADLIAPGIVDERDIRDIRPDELAGFTQCHFFAGIGVWSYALRQAGWPDDAPVWTGSCPCQPFSAAGGRGGFADERHLWPSWQWLIEQCGPEFVFGEQVASGAANDWLDLVQADLEAMDYAFGCVPIPAAGVGSPNIRDRSFWMAMSGRERRDGQQICIQPGRPFEAGPEIAGRGGSGILANPADQRRFGRRAGKASIQPRALERSERLRDAGGLADTLCGGAGDAPGQGMGAQAAADSLDRDISGERLRLGIEGPLGSGPGPTNGFWRNADWLCCTDGKWRPVEPGTFPLAHGAPARVGRLRGYGNAINAQVATAFIQAAIGHLKGTDCAPTLSAASPTLHATRVQARNDGGYQFADSENLIVHGEAL